MAKPATTTSTPTPATTMPPLAEAPKAPAAAASPAPTAKPPDTRHLSTVEKMDVMLATVKAKGEDGQRETRREEARPAEPREATPPVAPVKADASAKTDEKPPSEALAPQGATSDAEPVAEFAGATAPLYESLKAIPDPKVRAQVRAAIAQANAYKQVGMPLGEVKERKQLAPTIEVAREVHQTASRALELRGALASGTSEGVRTFIGALHQESPQAMQALVREVGEHIYELDRPAFLKIGEEAMKNALVTMRRMSEEKGDTDYSTAAELFESVIWPGGASGQPQQPQRDPNDVARLHALEQRERELDQRQRQGFIQGINGEFRKAVEKEADTLIKQADPEGIYPEAAVQKLREQITERVSREVITHPTIKARTAEMLNAGRYDSEQSGRVTSHLVNQARGILPTVAASELDAYGNMFQAVQTRRQQKLSEVGSLREISSGFPAPVTQPRKEINTRGMTTQEKLEALMAARR